MLAASQQGERLAPQETPTAGYAVLNLTGIAPGEIGRHGDHAKQVDNQTDHIQEADVERHVLAASPDAG